MSELGVRKVSFKEILVPCYEYERNTSVGFNFKSSISYFHYTLSSRSRDFQPTYHNKDDLRKDKEITRLVLGTEKTSIVSKLRTEIELLFRPF